MSYVKTLATKIYSRHRLISVLCLCLVIPLYLVVRRRGLSSTGAALSSIGPVQHVVFLKVHKAASSTMMNIFMRFGLSHNLNIMVPKRANTFSQVTTIKEDQFLHYSATGKYDILCCHVIYNKSTIAPFFPPDTRYIGAVREPFQQFLSAFHYYHSLGYLNALPGNDTLSTYLKDPLKFEPKYVASSFTNNRMSFDFGFPPKQFNNTSYIHAFLDQLVKELDFVIVVEYFDESLLMLKQVLNWKLEHIVYIPRNRGVQRKTLKVTVEDKDQHKNWARLDYLLYEKFLDIFLVKLKRQPSSFYAELETFRSIRQQVENFCKRSKMGNVLKVQESPWNEAFNVSRTDCKYMLMEARQLIYTVRDRYIHNMAHQAHT